MRACPPSDESHCSVTLIADGETYTAFPLSNAVLAGLRPLTAQEFSYDKIAGAGIAIAAGRVTAIDPQARTVRLGDGHSAPYDRLVIAPGIDVKFDAIKGYSEAATEIMPHAWTNGRAIRRSQAPHSAGEAFGDIPFDELVLVGVERDNDLWLRGHAGTDDGRKGAAPLGRRYFLANWEVDKRVYSNGIFTVKLGPFVDNGAIADSSGLFGSQKWLWDTGAQCKIRAPGSLTVVLIYGRDLRGGGNVFYGTALR